MFAVYDGLQFPTKLHAQWAAFFDLIGWAWKTNPYSVGNWTPDFRVTIPCNHSECGGSHALLVAVDHSTDVKSFAGHVALSHRYGIEEDEAPIHSAIDAGAVFGASPAVTSWEFSHGAGGGQFDVEFFVPNAAEVWSQALANVQKDQQLLQQVMASR